MKSVLLSLLLTFLWLAHANAAEIQGFGVIREFGGVDTAALFGLLPKDGTLQILNVSGPTFLGGFRLGEMTQEAIDHLFLKSSIPMIEQEKQDLVSRYKGAQVIYFEGYHGNLCRSAETRTSLSVSGLLNGAPFRATFQFIALPDANSDCRYHEFLTLIRN